MLEEGIPATGGVGVSAPAYVTYVSTLGVIAAIDVEYDFMTTAISSETPLPAALPLFASGLGALGLFGWCRKRKNAAVPAAA